MSSRDDLFQKFGPFLTETLIFLLLTEVNILRENQGLPTITEDDLITLALNHISKLEPYDWMIEE